MPAVKHFKWFAVALLIAAALAAPSSSSALGEVGVVDSTDSLAQIDTLAPGQALELRELVLTDKPVTPAETNLAASSGGPYHGNTKSHKFHRPGCRYYNCKNCTAIFQTREEAINAGYVPCKVCKP